MKLLRPLKLDDDANAKFVVVVSLSLPVYAAIYPAK